MSIWFRAYSLEDVVKMAEKNLAKHLGIQILELGDDFIKARMPVDERTRMPFGLLHGGASCVLAESLASYGAYFVINPEKQRIVGLEINANHIRSKKEGYVIGTVRPIHLGKSTHVWQTLIHDEEEKLICISRMTIAILDGAI